MGKPLNKFSERTIKTNQIYKGRIVTLREDTVELKGGIQAKREIVEHPGAVAVIALKDGKIVLVKQFRTAVSEVLLEVPAGLPKEGESAKETARRELEEETGYKAGKLVEVLSGYASPGYSTELIRYFLATDLTKERQSYEEDEFIEVKEIPISQCFNLIATQKIKDNKTIIGIMIAERETKDA